MTRTRGIPSLLTAAVLAVGWSLALAAPARAAEVFVEVNPSTVEAGYLIGIRASCPSNDEPARVESEAFGTVEVRPQYDLLTGTALVPEEKRARSYRVRLTCPGGRVATTTLHVVTDIRPSRGPATGFGGAAGGDQLSSWLIAGGLTATAAGVLLGLRARRRA